MNLHQITTSTLSHVAIVRHGERCPWDGCTFTDWPNDHHAHFERLWNVGVWYCTCLCTRDPVMERRGRYVYFPAAETADPGTTVCRDCDNGVHH